MLVLLLNMKDIDKLQQKLAYYEGREKELIQNQDRLRMAIEATDLGTWDYEPLTGALSWSEECKNIYGLAKGAAIDMDAFAAHIYPGDKEFVNRQIQNSMDPAGGGRYDITYRIIRFDDESVRWIRAQGKVYFNTNNQAERFIGTVLDITDSKEANERLARSEKLFRSIALNIPTVRVTRGNTQMKFRLRADTRQLNICTTAYYAEKSFRKKEQASPEMFLWYILSPWQMKGMRYTPV
jgi:PAS domain S-box-containing protein